MKKELNEFQIISKRNNKMETKRMQLNNKYSKMLGLRKEKLEDKKNKEIERFEKKRKKMMEVEIHNLTHKRQKKTPVDKTIGKIKAKALAEIQRYSKLSRAYKGEDGKIYVKVYDTMKIVMLDKKVNGGHVYSQRNYPHLAFDEYNIRPITSWGNRKQLDTTAEWIVNLPEKYQEYLKNVSKDKLAKNQKRDRAFFEDIIEKYKKMNLDEEKRLGMI